MKEDLARRGHSLYFWLLWCLVLWGSAFLRFYAPDWDQGIAAHPDERFVLGVAQNTSPYANLCMVSPEFPYGHLPVTFLSLVIQLAPQADPLYVARILSGLSGILLVALAGRCGSGLSYSAMAGPLAAGLAAFCPFLIQQAHFYTVDPWAAVFGTLAVLLATRHRWFWSGLSAGLAVACKASAIWIGGFLCVSIAIAIPRCDWIRVGSLYASAFVAGILVGAPWLVLAPLQCWRGPFIQAQLASGRFIFPYTRQYTHTLPWIYPFFQMFLWGMGPTTTVAGAIGFLGTLVKWKNVSRARLLTVVPAALFFIVVAGLRVKYPRYLLPIYPLWIGSATKCFLDLSRILRQSTRRWVSIVILLTVTAIPCIMGIAQVAVYKGVHPWVEASRWIYDRVEKDAVIGVESWDHPLPVPLPSGSPSTYQQVTVPVLDHKHSSDSSAEASRRYREASVVVLASRRNYGVVARQSSRFWEAYTRYQTMFAERRVVVFSRCPRIGPFAFSDNPFRRLGIRGTPNLEAICEAKYVIRFPSIDESFRVYDAPVTVLLLGDN